MCIINCELCGGSDFYEVGKWNFRIVVCKKCGFVFMNPVDLDYVENIYKCGYKHRRFGRHAFPKASPWEYERVDWVHRYCLPDNSNPRRLLEIGCNNGNLLSLFRKRKWEVQGVEPETKTARFAVEKRSLKVENCFWHEAQVSPNCFDVIILISTLEHITSPVSALEKVHKVLKPGGWLFLEVPNLFHERGLHIEFTWHGYRPTSQHLYVYSPNTMQLLLEKASFSIVEIATFREQLKVVAQKKEKFQFNRPPEAKMDDYVYILSVLKSNERTLKRKWPLHLILKTFEWMFLNFLPPHLLFRLRICKRFLTTSKILCKTK